MNTICRVTQDLQNYENATSSDLYLGARAIDYRFNIPKDKDEMEDLAGTIANDAVHILAGIMAESINHKCNAGRLLAKLTTALINNLSLDLAQSDNGNLIEFDRNIASAREIESQLNAYIAELQK